MAREAKLGLMFIGILLTVFCALLIKRLTKHPSLPSMNLSASATKPTDAAPRSYAPPQPAPPTLVTPQDDNTRPPEYAMNGRDDLKQNAALGWTNSTAQPTKTDLSREATPVASPPPSLLSEPLPVTEADNRYSSRNPEQTNELHTKAPLPYHSGYSAANDDSRSTPSTIDRAPPSTAPVDPFAKVNANETSPRADTGRETEQSLVNNLRSNSGSMPPPSTMPPAVPTIPPSGITSTAGDRYSVPPAPRIAIHTSPVSSDFAPRPAPTNEYLPRNNTTVDLSRSTMTNDFAARTPMSEVVPTSSVPSNIQRNGDQYTVQPNDSFWIISERAYGVGGYFKALFELNRKRTKDSEDLKVGEVLTVPDEAMLRRMYPDLCPKPRKQTASLQQRMVSANSRLQGGGRVYTIVEGDTLFEIARHELGKPSRWGEIYELNRDALGDDFDYLRPGMQLILPDRPGGRPADLHGNTATRQPDAFYPR
ncbi:MAG TPA: LysM peptidoglycan-binding domain-containing protein [Pirellulales bacterium]|jgi:nucleoid-associated protein YgaU|nr:LysM peptidoglycan-binding domain-containing protein [Pirellulales bacterium]